MPATIRLPSSPLVLQALLTNAQLPAVPLA